MSGLVIGGFLALAAWGTGRMMVGSRRRQVAQALVRHFSADQSTLLCFHSDWGRFRLDTLNGERSRWRPFVIAITPDQIVIRDLEPEPRQAIRFAPADLRWFGRPKKYTSGTNTLWLHVALDGRWHLVQVRLTRLPMQALVRALKQVATPEQAIAYRRRRPYVHFGPVPARPATQDIYGAWALGEPASLYLTPGHLVVLDGESIREAIPLETIQNVSAARRVDQPDEDGLVRFAVDGAAVAYALDDYEAFAQALSEAARRTLEDPVAWQRKKKKADEDDDALDDDEDADLME
jgi:hypothetical protein